MGSGVKATDGLTKSQRYRLKDVEAYREKKREYAKTPEERIKRREYMRAWREKNREQHNRLCRESHHRNRHKHEEKRRNSYYQKTHGIGKAQYDIIAERQGYACQLCGKVLRGILKNSKLHVDHDHASGRLRGLLCVVCNTSLGWAEKVGLEKIQDYLLNSTLDIPTPDAAKLLRSDKGKDK